ncbi:HEAT repeat domain-containing protein [Nostoc sp. TCL26-01]|uniref:HEAT repeat domain-containing protein n=1 Tax=Nostoc sp. TCL26-01 TaxID=2576904 RepID=UPI0015BA7853|nr:HEAT repeat domain-containing protein [Nostoc sp. TCL26-01]QLE54381.1 HEAT repeat domain-containing protein [Nostoc sp. TCL26-01]
MSLKGAEIARIIKFANEKQPSLLLAISGVAIMTTLPIVLLASTPEVAHTRSLAVDHAEVTVIKASALINKQACSSLKISQAIERWQSQIVESTQILVECGTEATAPLIRLLEDESKDTLSRRAAARVLSQIGSPKAIAALIRIAQQHRSGIRDSAFRAIADINPQARDTVPILIVAVADQDLEVSRVGMAALRRIDPAVPNQVISFLQEALRSNNTERRNTVRSLLNQLSSHSQANISLLTQALESQQEPTRAIAAYVLLQLGRKAQVAIPVLTKAMLDTSSSVRDTVACALGRIGSREAITVLITQLKTGNEATQASAAIGLSSLTAEAREALPVLIAALRDNNEQVRSMAAYALGQMQKHARRAIPALLGRLSDRSANVRISAAYSLAQIAPDDPRIIRLLVRQAVSDVDPTVRDSATESLGQITPEAASTLLEIFASQNENEAEAAAQLLLNLGSTVDSYLTTENLPKILQGISHVRLSFPSNSHRIVFANYALRQLGSNIVPTLISSLNSPNEDIRVGATLALLIGYSEKYFNRQSIEPAIPTLTQTFRNSRLHTLWKSKNQALVMAATQGDQEAYSWVAEIVFGDRLGLSTLALLIWLDESFLDDLKRENAIATNFVREEVFGISAAGGGELVAALPLKNNRPAICRIIFMQKFLWRCRQ